MFYVYVLLIIVFSMFFHELGHVLGMIINHIRINTVFLPLFVIKIRKEGLQISIWKHLDRGCVIPRFQNISSKEMYDEYRRKFARTILWGPFASGFLLISNIILYLLCGYYEWGCQKIFICFVIINFVFLVHCFCHGEQMGDFVAYKRIVKKESFFISYLLEYLIVSPDVDEDLKSDSYIEELLNCYINSSETEWDEDEMYVIYEYLTMLLAELIKKENFVSQGRLKNYIQNINFWMDPNHSIKNMLILRIIQYLYRWIDKEYAETLYKIYIKDNGDLISGEYGAFIKQTECVLGILDANNVVLEEKAIKDGHIFMEAKYLDEVIYIEKRIIYGSH